MRVSFKNYVVMLFLSFLTLSAQNSISGTVVDKDTGEPLVGQTFP